MANIANQRNSYIVTDLMATDLHTLLMTKTIGNQFVQYFVYQIMARQPVLLSSREVLTRQISVV